MITDGTFVVLNAFITSTGWDNGSDWERYTLVFICDRVQGHSATSGFTLKTLALLKKIPLVFNFF